MTFFFFQAEDGIRDVAVTGVQTCALPIFAGSRESIRQVPIRKASNPAARSLSNSPCVQIPDSLTAMQFSGMWSTNSKDVSVRTSCVFRLRLFTPMIRASAADRKSTRLNSSHGYISYAVFCLKKKQ